MARGQHGLEATGQSLRAPAEAARLGTVSLSEGEGTLLPRGGHERQGRFQVGPHVLCSFLSFVETRGKFRFQAIIISQILETHPF